jgi:predicted alpha/beta hydrolase
MSAIDLLIPATDGFRLSATEFADTGSTPSGSNQGVVLIVPAIGVKRRAYQPLASYLALRGFTVLTWDWRGIGGSRPRRLRGFPASLTLWATCDLPGVIEWAAQSHPGQRLYAIGHSFGGQAVGLAPNARRLGGLVTVAAPSGYWGHYPHPARWMLLGLWQVAMPGLTRLCGYFPAKRLRLSEDLPAGVALQWAKWCRSPDYLGDYRGHRRFARPLLAFCFTDDGYAPPRSVQALHREYAAARLTSRVIAPKDLGVDRIGHFGFFAEGRTPQLWVELVDWLEALGQA